MPRPKCFAKSGRCCANEHWHTWSCKIGVFCWVSWCLCAMWAFSTLRGQPWCMVGADGVVLGLASCHWAKPPWEWKTEAQPLQIFCWMGAYLSLGEEWRPEEGRAGACARWGLCKSSAISGFVCFLVGLGTALDLISAQPTFAGPFVNHLTLAQTCWEHQSHLPDHNVPGFFSFLLKPAASANLNYMSMAGVRR